MKVGTLIVGAGPAGSACGIRLRQAGVDCMVVDKQVFPRTKLCAGLFTHKSQDCLRNLIREEKYAECLRFAHANEERHFALYNGMSLMVDVQPDEPITLLSRPLFDEWMVQHFVSLGGRFRDGSELIGIDIEHSVAHFRSMDVEYDFLVAADGANSTVERIVAKQYPKSFIRKHHSAMCIEVNVSREDLNLEGVNIYFNYAPDTYAWAFSKGPEVCLGIGKLADKHFDVNAAMRRFLSDLNVKHIERYPLRGAMLPIGNYLTRPSFSNILFVGDAAGFVEPLTAEGIYYAMQSGVTAAESIVNNDGVAALTYDRRTVPLKRLIDKGAYYQQLLGKPWAARFFYRNAHKHPDFIKHFYTTQIEHACLDSFPKIIFKYITQ